MKNNIKNISSAVDCFKSIKCCTIQAETKTSLNKFIFIDVQMKSQVIECKLEDILNEIVINSETFALNGIIKLKNGFEDSGIRHYYVITKRKNSGIFLILDNANQRQASSEQMLHPHVLFYVKK